MVDPNIIFKDIECPKLRQQLVGLMEDLTQLCPSDACIHAIFGHDRDTFLASIKVASEDVFMEVADQASQMSEVMDHIKTKLMGQILDWRSHRFAC